MRVDVLLDLLDKSINDEAFRSAAHDDPRSALQSHGYTLTLDEFEAFMDFQVKAVQMSASAVEG